MINTQMQFEYMHIRILLDTPWISRILSLKSVFFLIFPSERSFNMPPLLGGAFCSACKDSAQTPEEMETCIQKICMNTNTTIVTTTTEPK